MESEEDPPSGRGRPGEDTGSPGDEAWRASSPPASRAEGDPQAPASSPASEPGDRQKGPTGGSMRFQDPATTRPRPPTVGEARARDKAARKAPRRLEQARVEAELKRHQAQQAADRRRCGGRGASVSLRPWAIGRCHRASVTAQCVQDDASRRADYRPGQLLLRSASPELQRNLLLRRPSVPVLLRQHGQRRIAAQWAARRSSLRAQRSRRRRARTIRTRRVWQQGRHRPAVREAGQSPTATELVVDRGIAGTHFRAHPRVDAAGVEPRVLGQVGVYYEFEMDEVLALEADVELLHSMCLHAVEQVVLTERYADFGLPEWSWQPIAESWQPVRPPRLRPLRPALRRLRPAKLLEYNADTPTSLLEAAGRSGTGWRSSSPTPTSGTRCTSGSSTAGRPLGTLLPGRCTSPSPRPTSPARTIHRRLPAGDRRRGGAAHRGAGDRGDRLGPGRALRRPGRAADQGDVQALPLGMVFDDDVRPARRAGRRRRCGSSRRGRCCSPTRRSSRSCGRSTPATPTCCPPISTTPRELTEYVRKPRLGREGANITIVGAGKETTTGGVYGEEGYVYSCRSAAPSSTACGRRWVRGSSARPAGLGIREAGGLVTNDRAAFVPHRIRAKRTELTG